MKVLSSNAKIRNILVVENSQVERSFIQQCFRASGHPCSLTFAVTVEDAYSLLHCGRFRLVVLDISLGGQDGLELVELMRSEPCLAFIPVVGLSEKTSEARRAYTAGVNVLIEKSHDLIGYQEKIKRLMDFWTFVAKLPDAG